MKTQINSPRKKEKDHNDPVGVKPMARGRKVTLTKESVKKYRVIVKYIQVTEEESKVKKATIERIMKRNLPK